MMKKYYVYRYFPHNGTEYHEGDEIELGDKQSRYWLNTGFIGKSKTSAKKIKEPQVKVKG